MTEEPLSGVPATVEDLDLFSMAFSSAAIGMALVAPNGGFINVNAAMCEITGYSRSELLARDFQAITHPDDLAADVEYARQLLEHERKTYQMEKRYIRRDGRTIWVLLTGSIVFQPSGAPRFFIAQVQDIDARKRAQADLTTIFALSNDLLAIASADGILQRINPAWQEILGWTSEELDGKSIASLLHAHDIERTAKEFHSIASSGRASGPFRNRYRHKQGGYRWLEWTISLASDGAFVGVARDVTQRLDNEKRLTEKTVALTETNRKLSCSLKDLEKMNVRLEQATHELERLAMYDSLTGLGNRNLFVRDLEHGVGRVSRLDEELAILVMDLNGFKDVNDRFGHAAGDTVLTEFGKRLRQSLPITATPYRLGGDEFAVVCVSPAGAGLEEAKVLAERISRGLQTSFRIKDTDQCIRASIGIAAFPAHGNTASKLLRNADAAMYEAKQNRQAMSVASDLSATLVLRKLHSQREPQPK